MSKKAIFNVPNVLVIGGAGFIGSHLCDSLIADNKVICVDNFLTSSQDNIAHLLAHPNFKFINHDIVNPLDFDTYQELDEFRVQFQGIQTIYFLGSPTSPKAYLNHHLQTLLVNSTGLRNALDLALKHKALFVYGSSPAVYGSVPPTTLTSEDYRGVVDHLDQYAVFTEAVRFGETLVTSYGRTHQLESRIARIANAYGPRMQLVDGRMIPEMIRAATAGEPIVIHGSQQSAGSYVYVSDVVKALIKITQVPDIGAINIGGEGTSTFTEIAQKIITLSGAQVDISYQDSVLPMRDQILVDISRAKEHLGWFPVVLFDQGLKESIDYLSAQHHVLSPVV
jgi:nucleoside-diphosphate-sugar epimerase